MERSRDEDEGTADAGLASKTDDERFLDGVLDRVVELMQQGQSVDAETIGSERPHLAERVRDQIRLAESITPRPRADLPHIDGYSIVAEAGRGGMGTVYLARQERLGGRPVALKVLSASSSLSPGARRRFRQESEVVARLRHPHIVAVHDVASETGPPAYAMEWVEGRSLAAVIDEVRAQREGSVQASRHAGPAEMAAVRRFVGGDAGPPSHGSHGGVLAAETFAVFVCRVGIAIARALGAVHRAGLVHRDVKPSNILVRQDGTPLLTDFGLARDQDATQVTQAGQFLGTPAYAPPEQLRGDAALDARTDVYSLGATLYQALSLRVPFDGRSTGAILREIESGKLRPLRALDKRLPRDMETIVAKAMDADPARRYATGDELADDLECLLTLRPIKARPAGTATRVWRFARRNRRSITAAAFSVLLTLAIVGSLTMWWGVLPRWVARELRAADRALLDKRQGDALWILGWHEIPRPEVTSSVSALDEALAHYRSAIRYRPFDVSLRRNRDILLLAQGILLEQDRAELATHIRPEFPRVALYFDAVKDVKPGAVFPRFATPRWLDGDMADEAVIADTRAVGMLAYLTGDLNTAIDAWSRLDAIARTDSFVDGALGMLFLVTDQPQRAYPRLEAAARAMPGVGFLTVYHADAARACGDFDKARLLLDEAACMQDNDVFLGLERVRANLEADAGDARRAEELYRALLDYGHNSVAPFHYARWLARRGELERALQAFAHGLASHEIGPGRLRREFVGLVERWWAALDPSAQARVCATPTAKTWIEAVRAEYEKSTKVLEKQPVAFVRP